MSRSRRWGALGRALLAGLFVLLAAAACREPAPQPLVVGAAPWRSGEVARYSLFDGNDAAGASTFSVSTGTVDGEAVWNFQRQTNGPGGAESVQVLMYDATLRPARSLLSMSDPSGTEQVNAVWQRDGRIDLQLTTKRQNTTYDTRSVPTDTYDQRTLPLLARALPIAEGYATEINLFLPYTGNLERYAVRVRGSEQVSVPAGTFSAWEVTFDNGERKFTYWVGVDAPHPIVQIEDANIRYSLDSFEPSS